MDIESAEAHWWFGKTPSSELPRVASDLLESGYDTESLRQVAGLDAGSQTDIDTLFERALKELGRIKLAREEAGLKLAKEVCREIVSGSLSPYQGARKIWWEIWENERGLDRLRVFVGLASEYEDDHKHREDYANAILREAQSLLSE